MNTCPDCGSRVYNLGCTWCNEEAYMAEQSRFDALADEERSTESQANTEAKP
jgi:hypothetical protein